MIENDKKSFYESLGNKQKLLGQTGVSIVSVRPASISEWDMIWHECEYSTYFHSREWAEIWSKYTKRKMFLTPFLVSFSDGKKALLPFSCLKKRRINTNFNGHNKTVYLLP